MSHALISHLRSNATHATNLVQPCSEIQVGDACAPVKDAIVRAQIWFTFHCTVQPSLFARS